MRCLRAPDFLYPFIEGDERDAGPLLADLGRSAVAKAEASAALRAATLTRSRADLDAAADAMAGAFAGGGRLFTFGNGGSSTDAASLAALFARPPWGRALPARGLVDDTAVLTALGNDVGFDLVFSRQLIAHGARRRHRGRVLDQRQLRATCSPPSPRPARRGMVTVGLAGYDGGEMAASPDVQHCLVVRSDSVHRVQETQAALGFALWAAVQAATGGRPMAEAGDREAAGPRPHRGLPPPPAPPDRRGRHDGPRRRRQGVRRARRRRLPRRLRGTASPGAAGRRRHADPADGRAAGLHHRLVRRAAAALPRRLDRPPRGARHGERPRRPGRPADVAVGRLRHRGGLPGRRAPSHRRRHGRGRRAGRRRHRHRRHEGGGPGRGRRRSTSPRRASASCRPDAPSVPSTCSRATSCWCRARSPTTAWR